MKETVGCRVYAGEDGEVELAPGDYGFRSDGELMVRPPDEGCHCCWIDKHRWVVTEHEDKTVTVSPSILLSPCGSKDYPKGWHGFLVKGVWREC